MSDELVHNIQTTVPFKKITGRGAHTLSCPICGDSKVRAAFFFDTDSVGYNCFRGSCSFKTTKYEFGKGIPKKFKELMRILGVEIPLDLRAGKKRKIHEELNTELFDKHYYTAIGLPDSFTPVDVHGVSRYADYLRDREVHDVEVYSCNQGEFANQLIFPFYYYDKLIGWQGVNIHSGQYITHVGDNSDLLYVAGSGVVPDAPILVEGVLDALSIPNGCATLHSSISKKQAYLLRNLSPVLLPDRKGSRFLDIAKQYGWRVSIPRWDYKDANEAVQHLGRLVVARMIRDGIIDNITKAEVEYKLWRTKK